MEATLMKVLRVISTTAIFLLLGATIPASAQEEHHEESAKPAQHDEQAKPAAKQEQTKPQKQEQQAKPAKQEQAKPEKQQQAKPQKQEQQAKSQEQNQQKQTQQQAKGQQQQEKKQQQQTKTQQNQEKSQQHQEQQATGHAQESHVQYARSGQKDSRGHEYNESHFGPNHHARFESSGGREYDGRREYSYGGYWFYAGAYPPWFYQRDVYFVMGPDGLWYAVAYDDPSLTFQVDIE
jgi:hypothetical protein